MNDLLSLGIAVGVLVAAAALVIYQRRVSQRSRAATVGVVFLGGVLTNYLLDPGTSDSFTDSLQRTLDWTYSALTMFAGAGSVEALQDLVTPSGLPIGVVQTVHYFLQVFAFLFTISAVVAALAKHTVDELIVRIWRYREVIEVHGDGDDVRRILVNLTRHDEPSTDGTRRADAEVSRRQRLVVWVRPDEEQQTDTAEPPEGVTVLKRTSALDRHLRRTRTAAVFLVDSGRPGFAEAVASTRARLAELERADGLDLMVLFVVSHNPATRDLIPTGRTPFEIRYVELAEAAARHLIAVAKPYELAELRDGEATAPVHSLVVSDGGPLLERIVEQLVIHSQFLGGRPRITVLTEDPAAASFARRHPEAHLSADIEILVGAWGSPALYERLDQDLPQLIVTACSDEAEGLARSHDLFTYVRLGDGLSAADVPAAQRRPRFLVRADSTDSEHDEQTFFGSPEVALSRNALLNETNDARARQVNAFYAHLDPADPGYDRDARAKWRGLSGIHRASSRGSADFLDAAVAVAQSAARLAPDRRTEIAAETEHLRWNAFYRMRGYRAMSLATMRQRFADATGDIEDRGRDARDDTRSLRHVCLVPWDELPEIDAAYNDLDDDLRDRDFQQTDRDVVQLVAAIRRAAPVDSRDEGQ